MRDLYVGVELGSGGNTIVNGELVNVGVTGVLMVSVTGGGGGSGVYGRIVLRMEALAKLAFGNVNGAGKWFGNVDVDVSLGVLRTRFRRTT